MDLAENLTNVRRRLAQACARAGREVSTVSLMAVSKGQPPSAIEAGARLGLNLFGESKVQEARVKIAEGPGNARWQMIGHLQSNKCREAVQLFEMIQSVDSLSLARELDKWAAKADRRMPILLEVNVAGEGSKFGYAPARVLEELAEIQTLPRLELQGLMGIPPWSAGAEQARPHFRKLRELKTRCEEQLGHLLPHLSMGMSADFEVAIEEGSTLVRVGTALFGPRASLLARSEG